MDSVKEGLKALKDENEIRDLAASFADACTSVHVERFASLWTKEGVWILSAPFNINSKGRESNAKLFMQLAADKRFFCQMLHSGVITIMGETATARWILSESAASQDGSVYQSLATYEDKLIYQEGKWLFQERYCKFLDITQSGSHN